MNDTLREKLAKIYELVKNGSTEGEQQAAKKALDRIIEKYGITSIDLESLALKRYVFKYSTMLEFWLLSALLTLLTENGIQQSRKRTLHVKEIVSDLTYLDWVTVDTAYEYFRRHMKRQFQLVCIPEIEKCRKAKTKAKRRKELQRLFIDQYLIKSKLYKPENMCTVELNTNSQEYRDRMKLERIKGGEYNRQLSSGLLLNN